MKIGDLDFEIQRPGPRLVVQVNPTGLGVETKITREDLESLARYCATEARKLPYDFEKEAT